jgi:hypothetical protein
MKNLTQEQKLFFKFIWPFRERYKQLNCLSVFVQPIVKNYYIELKYPHSPWHGLILPIKQPPSEYLFNLKCNDYQIQYSKNWQEAVSYLFRYFRGLVPEIVQENLPKYKPN